jgi:hypothetical protein
VGLPAPIAVSDEFTVVVGQSFSLNYYANDSLFGLAPITDIFAYTYIGFCTWADAQLGQLSGVAPLEPVYCAFVYSFSTSAGWSDTAAIGLNVVAPPT